jgi:ABC-type sugar transport system substrate-binding protein
MMALPLHARLKAAAAAAAAAPFVHPKLAVVVQTSEQDLVARLERAMAEREKVINARPVQVLPPPQVIEAEPEPLPDHSAPFAHNSKHRFRRF